MNRFRLGAMSWVGIGLGLAMALPVAGQHQTVIQELNGHDTIRGSEAIKSYRVLFDAYLTLDPPPFEVDEDFNLYTIHPGMSEWSQVSGWAESNAGMAAAILKCKDRNMIGLPYGVDEVDPAYRQAGIVVQIAVDGSLRASEFPYLQAVDTIAAYATAEVYRLLEAGQTQQGLDLAVAHIFVLRQFCDRQFLVEKLYGIQLLVDALANLRDVFYSYFDDITPQQYRDIAKFELPFLQPDRQHLLIPEGDKIISEALLEEVFDNREQADPDKFAATFGGVQSRNRPMERFGAARRWRMIAQVHSSLTASKDRLTLVYDDWWRRWRVQQYDDILSSETQFERTNPVRYAAVIYSMQDIEVIFGVRNQLVAGVSGTILSAGLCAYRKELGTYPDNQEKLYGQYVRKISDIDPYDREYGHLRFRRLETRTALDSPFARLWLNPDDCVLYARGEDHEDGRARQHSDDGLDGDLVLWPPIKALSRE